jgi:hypothetical protein
MRDPYIVRRRRTGIEAGYLKRITELESKNVELEKIIKEFLLVMNEPVLNNIKQPKLLELIDKAKKVVGE